jgi:FMN phosphatase YigB (HAD superfamily)
VSQSRKTKVLSLDVWDTLLRRSVHPDQIKIFSQQRILIMTARNAISSSRDLLLERQKWERKEAQQSVANEFDDEYEISAVMRKNLNLPQDTINEIIEFEFELEINFSFPDPEIKEFMSRILIDESYRIVVISDFYFKATKLKDLLLKHFSSLDIDEVIVSCEEGYNKRNRLFSKLLTSRPELIADAWIHVGDSKMSDVNAPLKHGIKSLHYEPKAPHAMKLENESRFNDRLNGSKWIQRFTTNERITLGLIGYSEFLRAEALRLNASILFLEREGLVLERLFKAASSGNLYSLPTVPYESLAVSRISIFAAAYASEPNKSVSRILFSYPNLTGEIFLKSLGIQDTEKFNLRDSPYSEFILDLENVSMIQTYSQAQLTRVRNYLESKIQKNKSYVLADVGWLGSMQEYLMMIFPESKFYGGYLGMQSFSRLHRIGQAKSFIEPTTQDSQKVLRNVRPIEMLFMPKGVAGVIGYTEEGEIVRNPKTSPLEVPIEFLSLQNQIQDLIPKMVSTAKFELLTLHEMRALLSSGLAEFLRNPSREILDSYLKGEHDETFGTGKRVFHKNGPNLKSIFMATVSLDLPKLRESYSEIGWVEASYYSIFKRSPNKFERVLFIKLIDFLQSISRLRKHVLNIKKIRNLDFRQLFRLYPIFTKSCREIGLKRTLRKTRYFLRDSIASQSSSDIAVVRGKVPPSIIPTGVVVIPDSSELLPTAYNWSAQSFIKGMAIPVYTLRELESFNLPVTRISKVVLVNVPASDFAHIQHRFPRANLIFREVTLGLDLVLSAIFKEGEESASTELTRVNRDVAWIIPTLPVASGGHRGMFRMALELEKHGFNPIFYVINDSPDSNELKSRFNAHYYVNDVEIRAGIPEAFEENFVVATAHYTLQLAKTRTTLNQRVVYFVQDDEALFNPVSSTYFKARETFFESDIAILASGVWMANRIESLTGLKVAHFDFPVDKNVYKSEKNDVNRRFEGTEVKQLVFYFKPDAERRMADLGLQVLRIVRTFAPSLKIVTFGSTFSPDMDLVNEHFGVFETIDEISNLYRESHIGLVFSPTNPSLIPYEMAACGVVVVDYCEPGDETKIKLCDQIGIQIAEASAVGIASKIIALLTDKEFFFESQASSIEKSREFATPEISGDQAVKVFMNLLNNPEKLD